MHINYACFCQLFPKRSDQSIAPVSFSTVSGSNFDMCVISTFD